MSEHSDPRIPPRDRVVLRYLLERHATERGDQVFVKFTNGDAWTYADMLERARGHAAGFARLGVKHGEHVLSFLPSSPDAICVWYGLNYLGAVYVPVNPAYKGNLLAHVAENSDARVVVVHKDLVERFAEIELAKLEEVVHLQGEGPGGRGPDEARRCDLQRDTRERGRACARAPNRALGHAGCLVHVWHDGPVEGRAVLLHAQLLNVRRGDVAVPDRR